MEFNLKKHQYYNYLPSFKISLEKLNNKCTFALDYTHQYRFNTINIAYKNDFIAFLSTIHLPESHSEPIVETLNFT